MKIFTPTAFKSLLALLFWLSLAGILFYFMSTVVNPNTAHSLSQTGEVVLQRDISGHYRAEAFINGIKIPVIVDTGATYVAIPQSLADQLGIHSNSAIRTQTANGDTVSFTTRLRNVKLGGIVAEEVAATINPTLGDEVLLGMSFLGRMDVRLYKGQMTIRAAE